MPLAFPTIKMVGYGVAAAIFYSPRFQPWVDAMPWWSNRFNGF